LVNDLVRNGTYTNLTYSSNKAIYSGKNLNIELTDNSENYTITKSKELAIIDTSNCEQLLKEYNILPQNEHLYFLNVNVKNSKYNNLNGTQYTLQSLYTSLFDSKGNSVNSSLCSDFIIKLPTGNLLPNQYDYEYMKNTTGVDIYNKTDPFFTDFCSTYSKNNSDIVLESRLELYPKQIECNAGCVYNGIDEHGYALCKCSKLPKEKVFNAARDLIFKLFNIANHKLVKCILNLFKVDLILVYGFFTCIVITSSFFIAVYIHTKFINEGDLIKHRPKVIVNDLLELNILKEIYNSPQNVGFPLDQVVDNSPYKPITQQVIINDNANLIKNNIIKKNVVEEKVNNSIYNNVVRDSITKPSNITTNNINNKYRKNPQALPIRQQDECMTRMVNNFIVRASTVPVVDNNQFEEQMRVVNTNEQIITNNPKTFINNIVVQNILPSRMHHISNINSILQTFPTQTNENIQNSNSKLIGSTLPNGTFAYTVAELAKAPLFVQFEIDERNSFTFYWHELKNGHEILNLYFYKSISTPFHIRLTILFISLSMRLCLSAMFFSDSYIKEQTDYKNKFGPDYTEWWYTFTNDILRILWPMLISVVFKNAMNLFILMSKEKLLEMNRFFSGGNIRIKEAM
jgi:hypothetical protein